MSKKCQIRYTSRTEKRSILVKPVQSEISGFCTELTTLTPDVFTEAESLADAVRTLKDEFRSKNRLWASTKGGNRGQYKS